MNIQVVTVIGAGQMGTGIAQVFAQSGYTVYVQDVDPNKAAYGKKEIERRIEKQRQKAKMTADEASTILERIKVVASGETRHERADLFIEAAAENLQVKKQIFKEIDRISLPSAILATNTSSLPITEIAGETKRPSQVIGMHFMNPVPVMELVEIIRGLATSDSVFKTIKKTAESLDKTAVEVHDFPGFVSNRVLMPMINEAIYAVYEGVAQPEAIDRVMTLGMNHPMGPLTLADFIGLDTCLSIMETLQTGFGDDKYRPCPLLRKYVKAGWVGRKAGRGFFTYSS